MFVDVSVEKVGEHSREVRPAANDKDSSRFLLVESRQLLWDGAEEKAGQAGRTISLVLCG